MKINFIPFKIGEQYENWEFDLEPVKTTNTYDQYRYFKKDTFMLKKNLYIFYIQVHLNFLKKY